MSGKGSLDSESLPVGARGSHNRVIENLTEEEAYLYAILTDPSGLDLAEAFFYDPTEMGKDDCFRAWPFQWHWWRNQDPKQIDQGSRSLGKSKSIQIRACAFPFVHPGEEMVITAPELIHLEPIVSLIEEQFYAIRLLREMLPRGRSAITHRPFQMNFLNGSRIIGRIPQRDGKGVKGCLCEDELILTINGHIPVQDLKAGDLVLSHEGRWRKVLRVNEDVNDCYEVRGQGSFPLRVSCDHRFLGAENLAGPKEKRDFDALTFHDVETLVENKVYWATPTKFPTLPVPEIGEGWPPVSSPTTWWLVGRYLADGWTTKDDRGVSFSAPKKKAAFIHSALGELGLHAYVTERAHSSADVLTVSHKHFSGWLFRHFGKLAHGKRLPAFVLGMDRQCREALLQGYLDGDGSYRESKSRWEVGTASKQLAVGVQLLAQTLGHSVTCTSVDPNVTEIQGVKLKNKPRTSWRVLINDLGHGVAGRVDDVLVGKVKSVTPIGKRKVFNPIIEGDHSYISGSIISHNIHPIWLEMDECFPAGTLILTKRGLIAIEQVEVGDQVFTHKMRWRGVTATFDRGERAAVTLSGEGHRGITCTPSHKFYAKSEGGWEWVEAQDMTGREWARLVGKSLIPGTVERVNDSIPQRMYDLEVEEDHSFIAEGLVVHNSQDYPALGWKELVETVKVGVGNAVWRAHGVTRGVQDEFFRFTTPSPTNDWTIHHYPAMWRPTWSDEERERKIRQYSHSRDDPDYRRNVLGLHGDATAPIFVSAQLMKSVDIDVASDYNINEYFKARISKEELEQRNIDIDFLLDFPRGHLSYAGSTEAERRNSPKAVYWAGMDIGMTIDPSEILVFVEYPKTKGQTEIKLLTRISMLRMPHEQQVRAILNVLSFYRPKAFCMDKGGLGYPFFQEIQEHLANVKAENWDKVPPWIREHDLDFAVKAIKGYTFSDKIVVGIDETIELGPHDDPLEKAGIKRNAKEHATDVLREIVDRVQFKLPWDESFIKEFQGATQSAVRSMDQYGKRRFSTGNDHCIGAGTLVTTERGNVPIESVVVGDRVLTRSGWRKVQRSWMASDSAEVLEVELSNGASVVATPEHRFHTDHGWVEAGDLLCGDILTSWHQDQRSLSSKGRPTGVIQTPSTELTGSTSLPLGVEGRVPVASTRRSGSRRMAPSLTDGLSITGMETPSTTTPATSSAFPSLSMTHITTRGLPTSPQPSTSNALRRSAPGLPNGIDPRRGGPGTVSMPSPSLPANQCVTPSVKSVLKSIGQSDLPSTALAGVGGGLDGSVCVLNVKRVGSRAVYDLTVEGVPEFFANGVLVHNCLDASRFFALGWSQHAIDEFAAASKKREPVFDSFL